MAYAGTEIREPGARRKKLAEYLKAANESWQSYKQGGDTDPWSKDVHGQDYDTNFPDAAIVRSGNEEMMLFPSYARKHTQQAHEAELSGNDAEYWQREWARHDDIKGMIDVEVRGWAYMPQRGAATRRQRLMIGLARQLSGISAPVTTSQRPSRSNSPERAKQEEDLIAMEAEKIVQQGKIEAEFAGRGAFSEGSGHKRSVSTDALNKYTTYDSDSESITPIQKRDSWREPARMSAEELIAANKHLLHRLRPFMATPLVESPVKAFFYNDITARERTVFTNPSGHFTCRATLDFVPTHVRVLAGDSLSATEEVIVTPMNGVSLISDIDDTIKHSAISAGAREIFRNAFIRDLGDLTIAGVKEWYTHLKDIGVQLHYVSNSPWQMYPILTSFFKTAGLPQGSFHLKQYSGMLQGIFEPVAERKKSSLDRIMRDFPNRKFILVGDSGEADLEVYTDVVLDNPGRILGVFIRDVTTSPTKPGYFDSTGGSSGHRPRQSSKSGMDSFRKASKSNEDDVELDAAIAASLQLNRGENKPALPQRMPSSPLAQAQMTADDEDLIDLSEELPSPSPWTSANPWGVKPTRRLSGLKDRSNPSPPPPKKPAALKGVSVVGKPPPLPPKPLTAIRSEEAQEKTPPPLPIRRGYREMAKEKIGNVLPSPAVNAVKRPTTSRASSSRIDAPRPLTAISPILGGQRHPDLSSIPDLPSGHQRRVGSSSSLASLRKHNRMSSSYSDDGLPNSPGEAGMSKKEFMWVHRLAKAKSILERQGVLLCTWRVGSDAQEVCVKLVEKAQKELEE